MGNRTKELVSVLVPKDLHSALKARADALGTSIGQLVEAGCRTLLGSATEKHAMLASCTPFAELKVFGKLLGYDPSGNPATLYTCRSVDVETARKMLAITFLGLARCTGARSCEAHYVITSGPDEMECGPADTLRIPAVQVIPR